MSLEDKIDALKTAVDALTAQIKGGAAPAGAKGAAAAAGKPANKPKNNAESVAEAAGKVKEAISKEAAVYLIKEVGKAAKLAEIKAANYDAFVAACEAAVEAGEVEGMAPAEDPDAM